MAENSFKLCLPPAPRALLLKSSSLLVAFIFTFQQIVLASPDLYHQSLAGGPQPVEEYETPAALDRELAASRNAGQEPFEMTQDFLCSNSKPLSLAGEEINQEEIENLSFSAYP